MRSPQEGRRRAKTITTAMVAVAGVGTIAGAVYIYEEGATTSQATATADTTTANSDAAAATPDLGSAPQVQSGFGFHAHSRGS